MKAIIPIAGLGTRCLPFTKVIPKAMLPVGDRPCVQWIVEELAAAGITDIIFVYSRGQEMVREYFSEKTWYDEELLKRGKMEEAKRLEAIRNLAKFQFVEQKEQLGDGHAILQAKSLIVPNEPFLVIFGDCLYEGDAAISKLQAMHKKMGSCVVALQKIPSQEAKHYGIAEISNDKITTLIEKPNSKDHQLPAEPLAMIGRYLLDPSIWPHLEKRSDHSGEIRLIDAFQSLKRKEPLHAVELHGRWLDTGTSEGFGKIYRIARPYDDAGTFYCF